MDTVSNYARRGGLAYSGRYGLGINRRTWNMGRAIGSMAKSALKNYQTSRKRKAAPSGHGPSKRSRSTSVGYQLPTGGGDSKSSFTLVQPMRGRAPQLIREFPASTLINNSSGRAEAAIGKQNFVLCGDYFTDTDINSGFALLNDSLTAKVLLKKVRGECLITNQENVNGRFTIYDVIARVTSDTNNTDPLTTLALGSADASGGTVNDYLIPGVTPYGVARFTERYKILQKTDVILSPGAVHSHVVNYRPNRYFSHELSTAIPGTSIAGLTLYTLVQFHGSPINDSTTQTQVSLSHLAMDFVQMENYEFGYAHAAAASTLATQTIPTAYTVSGNAMQDDGVARVDAEA